MDNLVISQIIIGITLLLMLIGKTPMFITALIGGAAAAFTAGILMGGQAEATMSKLLIMASLTGIITQSYIASAAIVLPFVSLVMGVGGDPMTTAVAAAAGCNIGQYYLTGGPVAGLNTVIPVVSNSELVRANKFQRPNILFGFLVAAIIVVGMSMSL